LGGDFLDVVEGTDGTLHVLIGDVSGHDPDAAALGVCLRVAWRTLVLGGRDPDHLLRTLEQVLVHERVGEDTFATATMLEVAPDRASARLRLAGHPTPILIAGGTARSLDGRAAWPPLGVELADGERPVHDVALPPGWSLLLYTDGLVEGRAGERDERLGTERLVDLVARHAHGPQPAATDGELIDRLIAAAVELNGGDLSDDVALLVVSLGDGDG
jgi:serine phosphatase RsbU (regulator of sigma subunit)